MHFADISRWQELLAAARGERPADLLLKNCRVVNVFSGDVVEADVAVFDGRIAGLGDYDAREVTNLRGAFLAPGFIEGHIHVESSKLTPPRFAEAVVPRGTTAVVADPHEIANVWGIEGIRYMNRRSRGLPLDFFYMLPSCVPATSMETSGAKLSAADLYPLLADDQVLGIGELMNFPGAFLGDPEVLAKSALSGGVRPVDGHSPGLSGKNLAAYIAAGPATDHECNRLEEAAEKLALGMRVMIREGSTARNLKLLLPLVTPQTERRCLLVSDDRRPGDLTQAGHLDHLLRLAVAEGLDPVTAVRLVTLNVAETFGLRERGGIRPGWQADMVALRDLDSFQVLKVWKDGVLVAEQGNIMFSLPADEPRRPNPLLVPHIGEEDFQIRDEGRPVRVIGIVPDRIITEGKVLRIRGAGGLLSADPSQDVAKLVVVERHTGSGRTAVAFVQGMGLREGAIGSTVAHDSHNIIVAGMEDRSILTAVSELVSLGGGQVATLGDRLLASLPLPVAGLMSELGAAEVAACEDRLIGVARQLGSKLGDPFMALSFLALPVIPELKLTDYGLVDVRLFKHVPLYV